MTMPEGDAATFIVAAGIMVPMRDGFCLATDIYRPTTGSPTSPLLTRTPYDKDRIVAVSADLDLFRALRAGYAVVVQDVRGRYASEGQFDAYAQEAGDGVDTIAWIAAQPWSDGQVATFGKSYLGVTQWMLAPEQPPALRAMAASMTPGDLYEGTTYQGGAHILHPLRWAAGLSADGVARRRRAGQAVPERWLNDLDADWALRHLPLDDHPAYPELAPFWPAWMAHPSDGPYWRERSPSTGYDRVTVPVLNIAGWYDILLGGVIQNYRGVRDRGNGDAKRSQLIIGPWSHLELSGHFPDRDFGPDASSAAIDLDGQQLRWFDRWVRGESNGVEDEPPVRYFLMGVDEWRSAKDWPPPDMRPTPWYLDSDGSANSVRGDGSLVIDRPARDRTDTLLSDPHRPVSTVGGQVLLPGPFNIGPRDQRDVEARDDVLVYSTGILDQPVEVVGPVEVRLFVASSAPDTDVTAKLVDVFPDGRAINLTDGIIRTRYRTSTGQPEMMLPGAVYELRIDLWSTANVFLPGHRIRLEVAGSNFPRFGRNSHTGGDIAQEPASAYQVAVNRVLHGPTYASRLMLPVIESAPYRHKETP